MQPVRNHASEFRYFWKDIPRGQVLRGNRVTRVHHTNGLDVGLGALRSRQLAVVQLGIRGKHTIACVYFWPTCFLITSTPLVQVSSPKAKPMAENASKEERMNFMMDLRIGFLVNWRLKNIRMNEYEMKNWGVNGQLYMSREGVQSSNTPRSMGHWLWHTSCSDTRPRFTSLFYISDIPYFQACQDNCLRCIVLCGVLHEISPWGISSIRANALSLLTVL